MDNSLLIVVSAIMIVVASSTLYKFLPFKHHHGSRPIITLFPKYIATFQRPIEDIELSLAALGFKGTADPGFYYRGKTGGGFSAKSVKLSVKLDKENSTIKVQTSFLGILFDMGDIWQVTNDILTGSKS